MLRKEAPSLTLISHIHEQDSSDHSSSSSSGSNNWIKWSVLIGYTIQNAALLISLRSATFFSNPDQSVVSSTEVLLSEIIKLLISLTMCFIFDADLNINILYHMLGHFLSEDSSDFVKLSIPAILYIIQNNLQYIIETRVIFLMMYQLKIISTAIFYSNMIARRISTWEWAAIMGLALG